jgi:hypothetical protein
MSKLFWKAAGVRAVKTMAQVLASLLVIGTFKENAWSIMLQTTLLSGLASVLTSLAGLPEVTEFDQAEIDMLAEHYDSNRREE